MREWSREDLDRWGQQIRDNDLPYKSQLEIVQFSQDLFQVVEQARSEVDSWRQFGSLLDAPLRGLVDLRRRFVAGEISAVTFEGGCLFWLKHIDEDLLT